MKKITLLLFLSVILTLSSFAQDNKSNFNEVGINFSYLNNFGLRFKHGNDTSFLRLTLISINGYNSHATPDTLSENKSSIGLGFNIGFERRNHLNAKSSFYYGMICLHHAIQL